MTPGFEFIPAKYSLEENRFFLDQLGRPPIAVLDAAVLPSGVNRHAVEEVLGACYDRAELERHRQKPWAGLEAVKDVIVRYLQWYQQMMRVRGAGGPRFASQHLWDSAGRPYKYGVGADTDLVKTEILEDGTRRPLSLFLDRPAGETLPHLKSVAPWTKADAASFTEDQIAQHDTAGRVECSICGAFFAFKPDNRSSLAMARANMARHLKHARNEPDRHRILHTKLFR